MLEGPPRVEAAGTALSCALSRKCSSVPLCGGSYEACFETARIRYFKALSILRAASRTVGNLRGSKVPVNWRASLRKLFVLMLSRARGGATELFGGAWRARRPLGRWLARSVLVARAP